MRDDPKDRPLPDGQAAADRSGEPRSLSARDLQENASEGPLEAEPGSDADQANEVPHVG